MRRILDTPGTTWPRWPRGVPFHRLLATASSRAGPVPPAARRPDRGPDTGKPNPTPTSWKSPPIPRPASPTRSSTTRRWSTSIAASSPRPWSCSSTPKRNIEAAGAVNLRSRQGWTGWRLSWRIAKLWEIPAEELLAASDVGLIPWVPLTQFDGPPEPIVRQCRARIDQDAPPHEHENLLAVTQFLTRLRYHDPKLFQLLGGRKAMIESPLLEELKAEWTRELKAEWTREAILKFLEARFGIAARALEAELKTVDEDRLDDLLSLAATCRTLASFQKKVSP